MVALALVACADKSGDDTGNGGDAKWVDVTVYAQSGGANTKTLLDDAYDYFWTPSDQIGLFATDNNGGVASELCIDNLRMTNDNTELTERTSFSGKLKESDREKMPNYDESKGGELKYFYAAYYPYKSHIHLSNGFDYFEGFTLPTEQVPSGAKAGGKLGAANFPVEYDIMVAPVIEDGTIAPPSKPNVALQFEHLFAAVQFTLADDFYKGGSEKVRTITLTAPEGTPLTGGFRVSTNKTPCEIVFGDNAANYVTLDMSEYDGLGVGETVWALVNPAAINSDVVLTIETMSGFSYTYTYPVETYTRGRFNSCEFVIPAFNITANIYTSYTRYAAGDVEGANAIDGSMIFVNKVRISEVDSTPDSNGGTYDIPYDEVGVSLKRGSVEKMEPHDFESMTEYTTTCTSEEWGEYDAQVYVKLANGKYVTSKEKPTYVTGLPYSVNMQTSQLNSDWTGGGIVYKGYIGSIGDYTECVRLDRISNDDVTQNGWLVSPKFPVPSSVAIGVDVDTYHYRAMSTLVDTSNATMYVNACSGTSSSAKTNGISMANSERFYPEATFSTLSFGVNLTPSQPNVSVTTAFEGSETFFDEIADYFTVRSINIKYQ